MIYLPETKRRESKERGEKGGGGEREREREREWILEGRRNYGRSVRTLNF